MPVQGNGHTTFHFAADGSRNALECRQPSLPPAGAFGSMDVGDGRPPSTDRGLRKARGGASAWRFTALPFSRWSGRRIVAAEQHSSPAAPATGKSCSIAGQAVLAQGTVGQGAEREEDPPRKSVQGLPGPMCEAAAPPAELRCIMEQVAALWRECGVQELRVDGLVREVATLRVTMERMATEQASQRTQTEERAQASMEHMAGVQKEYRTYASRAAELASEMASVWRTIEGMKAEEDSRRAQHRADSLEAMERVAAVQLECSVHSSQLSNLAQELASVKSTVENRDTDEGNLQVRFQADLQTVLENIANLERKCSRIHAGFVEELSLLRQAQAQSEPSRRRQQAMLAERADIPAVKPDGGACRRLHGDVQGTQQGQHEVIALLRAEQEALRQRMGEVPGLTQRQRDQIPRVIERFAFDVIERVRAEPDAQPSAPAPAPDLTPPKLKGAPQTACRQKDSVDEAYVVTF